MALPLATSSWDEKEIQAMQKVIDSQQFTMNKHVQEFEDIFKSYHDSKYCVMVNSGSSANLLAVAAFFYHSSKRLKRGDEIIVPAVSWATTYSPLYLYGLKIKFVDIDADTLNIDENLLRESITESTKAIFLVNLLGNANNFDAVKSIAENNNLIVIEDNCESLGATFKGKKTGTFGDVGTFSFFFSHHISTMEGGAVVTDDEELYHILLSIRSHGWTRHLPSKNKICQQLDNSFYESFRFILPGYNMRPLELSGAIGVVQMEKIDRLIEERRKNALYYKSLFRTNDKVGIQKEIGNSSWFSFSFVLDKRYGEREKLKIIDELKKNKIESRPIVAGNFTNSETIDWYDYEIFGSLENSDLVHRNGFMVGNHHYPIIEELDKINEIFERIL